MYGEGGSILVYTTLIYTSILLGMRHVPHCWGGGLGTTQRGNTPLVVGVRALRAAMVTAQMTYRSNLSRSHSSRVMFLFLSVHGTARRTNISTPNSFYTASSPHLIPPVCINSITYSTYYFLHSTPLPCLLFFFALFRFLFPTHRKIHKNSLLVSAPPPAHQVTLPISLYLSMESGDCTPTPTSTPSHSAVHPSTKFTLGLF